MLFDLIGGKIHIVGRRIRIQIPISFPNRQGIRMIKSRTQLVQFRISRTTSVFQMESQGFRPAYSPTAIPEEEKIYSPPRVRHNIPPPPNSKTRLMNFGVFTNQTGPATSLRIFFHNLSMPRGMESVFSTSKPYAFICARSHVGIC